MDETATRRKKIDPKLYEVGWEQEQSWDNEIVHRNENRILMFIINQNKNYDVVLKSFNQNN